MWPGPSLCKRMNQRERSRLFVETWNPWESPGTLVMVASFVMCLWFCTRTSQAGLETSVGLWRFSLGDVVYPYLGAKGYILSPDFNGGLNVFYLVHTRCSMNCLSEEEARELKEQFLILIGKSWMRHSRFYCKVQSLLLVYQSDWFYGIWHGSKYC